MLKCTKGSFNIRPLQRFLRPVTQNRIPGHAKNTQCIASIFRSQMWAEDRIYTAISAITHQRFYCSGSSGAAPHLQFQCSVCWCAESTVCCTSGSSSVGASAVCLHVLCWMMPLLLHCLFDAGVLHVVSGKQPCASGKAQTPTQMAKLMRKREIFLGNLQGLNGVDTTQDATESCWTGLWAGIFSSMLKKLFSPSYLWLFQSQWGCCASRKSICLPPGQQI